MKVGDWVLVSHEIMDDDFLFDRDGVREMRKYAGEIGTILFIDASGYSEISVDDGEWWWHEDALIPIEEDGDEGR
ncbi:MAG: hypothetical protein ACRC91_02410 [Aeromonas sp.]